MQVQLLWGCDPARQFEVAWLHHLIGPALAHECCWWRPDDALPAPMPGAMPLLVESGLLRLERSPAPERLARQEQQRRARVAALQRRGRFAVVHLSDEEGVDADGWYHQLPHHTPIWRNFPHGRFETNAQVRSFPIGPRDRFLAQQQHPGLPASCRPAPWAFMGTLWPSGSRKLAVSLFLAHLPRGLYFGGHRFGQGLALEHYQANLQASVFALAPEGDRHLDTFRLWESLCCGCIPLLVEHRATAARLLMAPHPLPVFHTWPEALGFAQRLLADPPALDALQARVSRWWQRHQLLLTEALADSLRSGYG
jgi:hypothetical protein